MLKHIRNNGSKWGQKTTALQETDLIVSRREFTSQEYEKYKESAPTTLKQGKRKAADANS
jgi:hypothetical protein